ncbi:hypothetical protein [Microbispora hainanensis]|uniref:hypothetical protein n=1 Tax=Microbispora hainanensis TaxID=568844 RepID=UPI00325641BE
MTVGDWVQAAVGVLGLVATILVAWMVYRLQHRDNLEVQKVTKKSVEEKQSQEAERERRALRREQHRDDYKTATSALNTLSKVCDQVITHSRPLTPEEFSEVEAEKAAVALLEISKRIPGLKSALSEVYATTAALTSSEFPSQSDLEFAMTGRDDGVDRLYRFVREACSHTIAQSRYADRLQKRIAAAREAISQEWGS